MTDLLDIVRTVIAPWIGLTDDPETSGFNSQIAWGRDGHYLCSKRDLPAITLAILDALKQREATQWRCEYQDQRGKYHCDILVGYGEDCERIGPVFADTLTEAVIRATAELIEKERGNAATS